MMLGRIHWAIAVFALLLGAGHEDAFAQKRSLVISPVPTQPAKEQRLALVIGNSRYDAPLRNAVNDARAIATQLREVGFAVTLLEDAPLDTMFEAIRAFGDQLRGGGAGLFYFAGHGVQIGGRNYLIPVGSKIEREDEVVYRSIDAGQVLNKMASAGNRVNLVILDACRSNPFARSFRAISTGLAVMEAPPNTLIGFATSPGAVASDGGSAHGLYTEHLLRHIPTEGLRVEDMFKLVRAGVRHDSAGRQLPWENTSLEVEFYFRPLETQVALESTAPNPLIIELAFWESIKGSTKWSDYDAYLRKFPEGQFVELARNRVDALRPPPAAAPPPMVVPPEPTPPKPPPVVSAPLHSFSPSEIVSTALALSPNGGYAVSGLRDGMLSIWEITSSKEFRRLMGHSGAILTVSISSDGRFFASGGEDATIRLWSFSASREVQRIRAGGVITALAFSPNGRNLVSGDRSGAVKLWNAADGALLKEFPGQTSRSLAVGFSANGRYVLSGAADGYARVWDVGSGASSSFGPHSSEVLAVHMSADGARLTSASADGALWSWDVATRERSSRVSDEKAAAALAAITTDGRNALIARSDGQSTLWDTQAARAIKRFTSPASAVTAVALSPEGRLALVAADGQQTRLWALRE
jgi:WD40 repeat protein